MTYAKKLIEVAPLEASGAAPAREKSIRHGRTSTLHLWWARGRLGTLEMAMSKSTLYRYVGPDGEVREQAG